MLHTLTIAAERRRGLRERLAPGRLLPMPGALNSLSVRLIQESGFEAVYLSRDVAAKGASHQPRPPVRQARSRALN
jgi:methylisocitrate lyase